MPEFKVPVTWEMCGWVKVEAADMKEALEKFDPQVMSLPPESEQDYVDSSYRLTTTDPEEALVMQPPRP